MAWRQTLLLHRKFYNRALYVVVDGQLYQSGGAVRCFSNCRWAAPFDAGQPTSESHPEAAGVQLEKYSQSHHFVNVAVLWINARMAAALSRELFPGITVGDFAQRRKALRSYLPTESMVILESAPVKQMTEVVPYPYRQDADYLYFTGCQQPEGLAVLDDHSDLCMFMPDRDPEREVWAGKAAGTKEAIDVFGADRTHPLRLVSEILPEMVACARSVFCDNASLSSLVRQLPAFQTALQQGRVRSLNKYSHLVRWIKSESELKLMRRAAGITCKAMQKSMHVSRSWPHEHLLAATVEYECKIRGAQRMAGGVNGSVIHYSRNDKQIKGEAMVLLDVGCEFHGYVSDMTRTWPPCGYFSPARREVYEIVLDVMKECFKMCRPGVTLGQIHNHSVELLWKGLLTLGLAKGPFNIQHYYKFNRTQVGHYLGMDVHDCSTVSLDRPLQPGVVITIEPGLYLPVEQDIPERLQGIGIRIEDEVLITATGYEVLTATAPKEIEEIESWLSKSSLDHEVLERPQILQPQVGV